MSVVLATAGFDHRIRFWEAPSGVCSRIIKFPDSQVNKLEITPDKQFIAAAGNPVIRLYEILAPGNANSNTGGGGGTGGGATGGATGNTQSQQQQEPQQAVLTLEGHTSNVTSVGFQKDGRYLYSGSEDGTIKVWDLRNPHYSRSFDSKSPVNSVCLRTDKDQLISGDQNGYVKIWDLGGKGCIHSIRPSSSSENNTAGGGGGGGGDNNKNNINNENKNKSQNQKDHKNRNNSNSHNSSHYNNDYYGAVPIAAVDISEDSRTLVAVTNKGTVFVWDPTGLVVSTTPTPTQPQPSVRKANANTTADDTNDNDGVDGGGGIADTTNNNNEEELLLKSSSTGMMMTGQLRSITKFRATAPGFYCLHGKIAPDCRHLVTTGSDGLAKLWDTTTWECTETLDNNNNGNDGNNGNNGATSTTKWVWDAAFCADSSYLVTASSDKIGRLWNLRTGDVVRKYHGHQSAVTCVALNDSSV